MAAVLGLAIIVLATVIMILGSQDEDETAGAEPGRADAERAGNGTDEEHVTKTVEIDGIPEQIPDTIVPDGAHQVTGTIATQGEAWSALARFQSDRPSDELVEHVHLAATAERFRHRERSRDETSTVSVYDGSDGSILTVTVRDMGDHRSVGAVRVSP